MDVDFKLPECPKVTIDGIIEYHGKLIIIERKYPPLGPAWPGGFVDVGESCEDALHRELAEEVNLKVKIINLIGIYSDPHRDKRAHIISIAYFCESRSGIPKAKDDAKRVKVVTLQEALDLTFIIDHKKMLIDALNIAENPLAARLGAGNLDRSLFFSREED